MGKQPGGKKCGLYVFENKELWKVSGSRRDELAKGNKSLERM
jgi:hypothetical protein